MEVVATFLKAWNLVFMRKRHYLYLVIASLGTFFIFIIIPVLLVPGNNISYQLSIMPFVDFITLSLLSFITGLAIIFNLYIFKQKKHLQKEQIGHVGVTGAAALLASFFGAFTCIACAATVVGFFGLTAVTFALQYRLYFALTAVFLMVSSVYFTARKVLHICERCSI